MMRRLKTIGVYGWDAGSFSAALRRARVGLLIDVRQRRGVRGPEYSWANSRRLQGALADLGIDYEHRRDLAPTTELRQLQYAEDDRLGVGKRNRSELAAGYVQRYCAEILDAVDLDVFAESLPERAGYALLCVERDPEACHRSLIAARLAERDDVDIEHLLPEGG